ncbi:MAG: NAD(P)-dependent alcohol dehydrogenase [Halieaceae bacterium]
MKLRYKIGGTIVVLLVLALSSLALVLSHNKACPTAPELAAGSNTMKAIVYRCYGPPEVLQLEDREMPTVADNEVLVKIEAASVNPLDWHYMRGAPYVMRLMGAGLGAPADTSMGVDFAGTIEAVGSDVTRFQPGDEVFGGRGGAFGEYLSMPEDRAISLKPDNVSFEQAAAVPIAAVSALQALRDKGQLQAGQKVLINGASGGVGTYAVQIAKAMGAEVTGVCSTRNLDMVRSIGADHVIDYKKDNFTEREERYDLVIDNVGNHSFLAYRNVLKPGGMLVIVGGSSGNWIGPFTNPLKAVVGSPFVDYDFAMLMAVMNQDDLAFLAELMASGEMSSVIDRRYPLSEVAEAVAYSESGRARGKIIVNVVANTTE